MSPSPALFIPLPANIFPIKLASNVPNNMLGNPPFCYLTSLGIVLLSLSNNKPESSRGLTIFIMSSISFFDIINVVLPEPIALGLQDKIFLCIPVSAADAAAVNPNGIKKLLANGLIMVILFLIIDQEVDQEILLIVSS